MNPPGTAFGTFPQGEHRQRPGKAGSAVVARLERMRPNRVPQRDMDS